MTELLRTVRKSTVGLESIRRVRLPSVHPPHGAAGCGETRDFSGHEGTTGREGRAAPGWEKSSTSGRFEPFPTTPGLREESPGYLGSRRPPLKIGDAELHLSRELGVRSADT